jgi:integrase
LGSNFGSGGSTRPLRTRKAWRAVAACIHAPIGNHTFRATGITAYLKNGGTLEKAASMANHASTRTTQLYDRRLDEMSLDEVAHESPRTTKLYDRTKERLTQDEVERIRL